MPTAGADFDLSVIGARDFSVVIDASCSGYEGVALVLIFLGLFLWSFRDRLLFPRALLLIPLGVGLIWLLNAVRIAVLVAIGAHVSPAMALEGFHSQAGWVSFLLVTVGLMYGALGSTWLARSHRVCRRRRPEGRG